MQSDDGLRKEKILSFINFKEYKWKNKLILYFLPFSKNEICNKELIIKFNAFNKDKKKVIKKKKTRNIKVE